MGNVVHKLTNQDIEQLLNQINFSTSNLPNGMKEEPNIMTLSLVFTILVKLCFKENMLNI